MRAADTLGLAPFDAADYLTTPGRVVAYLNAALAENDTEFLQEALATVMRSPTARTAFGVVEAPGGSSRSSLDQKAEIGLSGIFAMAKVLGLKLQVVAR